MGKEAAEFTRKLVEGKQVRLEYDVQRKDRYGRTLAYVSYLEHESVHFETPDMPSVNAIGDVWNMLNAELVRSGYAQAMTIPPNVKYQELFLKLQKEARESKRGLWKE